MTKTLIDFYNEKAPAADVIVASLERLMEQGARGFSIEKDRCEYKNEAGNSCAVGVLLPEDFVYFEYGGDVKRLIDFLNKTKTTTEEDDIYVALQYYEEVMCALQMLHDTSNDGQINSVLYREVLNKMITVDKLQWIEEVKLKLKTIAKEEKEKVNDYYEKLHNGDGV